jgi:hypothetical protein
LFPAQKNRINIEKHATPSNFFSHAEGFLAQDFRRFIGVCNRGKRMIVKAVHGMKLENDIFNI